MNDNLRDLYQEVILDHGRHPRNHRVMSDCSHFAHGENPLCGDKLVVFLNIGENNKIVDVAFDGQGCAISTASASLMTEMLLGKDEAGAKNLFEAFHALTTGEEPDLEKILEDDLERLMVLAGVRDYPVRVKCATLAWHTMTAALSGQKRTSTE